MSFSSGFEKTAVSTEWALKHMSRGIAKRTGASPRMASRSAATLAKSTSLREGAHQAKELFPRKKYIKEASELCMKVPKKETKKQKRTREAAEITSLGS